MAGSYFVLLVAHTVQGVLVAHTVQGGMQLMAGAYFVSAQADAGHAADSAQKSSDRVPMYFWDVHQHNGRFGEVWKDRQQNVRYSRGSTYLKLNFSRL